MKYIKKLFTKYKNFRLDHPKKLQLNNIKQRLNDFFIFFPRIKNPKVAMTLLVKNEADIIRENILFHKKIGIDYILVTDNGSTDGTLEILQDLLAKGIIDFLEINCGDFFQAKIVDSMIHIAQQKFNPDYIINSDADEFWYSKNLKKSLSKCRKNVIRCDWQQVFPSDSNIFCSKYIVNKYDVRGYDLSPFSIYKKGINYKVIHRSKGYIMISEGNHSVNISHKAEKRSNKIKIYHYSIRNKDHFYRKFYYNAIAAFNAYNDKVTACHWKYYYNRFTKDGASVDEEYDRHIGKKYFDIFLKKKILCKDTTISDFLIKNNIVKVDNGENIWAKE